MARMKTARTVMPVELVCLRLVLAAAIAPGSNFALRVGEFVQAGI
jgi:hypothetical protein